MSRPCRVDNGPTRLLRPRRNAPRSTALLRRAPTGGTRPARSLDISLRERRRQRPHPLRPNRRHHRISSSRASYKAPSWLVTPTHLRPWCVRIGAARRTREACLRYREVHCAGTPPAPSSPMLWRLAPRPLPAQLPPSEAHAQHQYWEAQQLAAYQQWHGMWNAPSWRWPQLATPSLLGRAWLWAAPRTQRQCPAPLWPQWEAAMKLGRRCGFCDCQRPGGKSTNNGSSTRRRRRRISTGLLRGCSRLCRMHRRTTCSTGRADKRRAQQRLLPHTVRRPQLLSLHRQICSRCAMLLSLGKRL